MSASHADIAATLHAVLVDQVLDPSVSVDHDTPLAPLGVDSMSFVRMLLAVERDHGIAFPDDEMTPENLATVNSLTAALVRVAET